MSSPANDPSTHLLVIDGCVTQPQRFTWSDLHSFPAEEQVDDLRRLGAKRGGSAVRLQALLARVGVDPRATHVGLHGSRDNFHASIPLAPVVPRAWVIYAVDGQPLPVRDGGPFRFFVTDHAACHAAEIDECANVKFVDRIELTIGKGFDNRPQDDTEHARLHADAPHEPA